VIDCLSACINRNRFISFFHVPRLGVQDSMIKVWGILYHDRVLFIIGIYIYHDLSGVITVKSIVEIINSKLNVMYRKENVRHYTPIVIDLFHFSMFHV
jgi:hypothetical protein